MTGTATTLLFTPFGAPFDTAVLAGLVLTGAAVALAGRGRGHEERTPEADGRKEDGS